MPVRIMGYDAAEYNRQMKEHRQRVSVLWKQVESSGQYDTLAIPVTYAEYMSGILKTDRLHPVYTICLYSGTETWDGPRTLLDMMEFRAEKDPLKEYFAEGEQEKWKRHTRVFVALHQGLEELGFQDVIKREWQAGLVITVKYPDDPNWSFSAIHDYCYERGFTIYPGKINNTETFRLCALGAVDEADIQEFFKVFQAGLESMKVAVPVFYREEK